MSLAKNASDKISVQEYLKGEKVSEVRHEYIDGYVYAMSGGTDNHNLVIKNVLYSFEDTLRKRKSPCKIFSENVKLSVQKKKKDKKKSDFFYPDVFVICDKHKDDDKYYKHSPVIIVEVLSDSTREYDLTAKKLYYFDIPALQEYVVIEQDICQVIVFRKNNDWKPDFYYLGNAITFESIGVILSVEDIYYQVDNNNIAEYLKKKEQKSEEAKN